MPILPKRKLTTVSFPKSKIKKKMLARRRQLQKILALDEIKFDKNCWLPTMVRRWAKQLYLHHQNFKSGNK
jgi:hypothetical protein